MHAADEFAGKLLDKRPSNIVSIFHSYDKIDRTLNRTDMEFLCDEGSVDIDPMLCERTTIYVIEDIRNHY